MSILIKGMEMPKNCDSCPCYYETEGAWRNECEVLQREHYITDERPDWCPIAPVPPHGDLIERKAACLTDFEIAMCDGDYKEGMKMLLEKIESAPTIIPESESVKTEEDSEPWLCLSCRNYPPSSTDGKPCTQCDPCEVLHSCYDPAEDGE